MNDIVYFVKETLVNEELRYSLRSVEKNFPFNKVWIYGGKPNGIQPDEHIYCRQVGMKWERVRNMLRLACQNNAISEDFWLFNDDFFILKPMLNPENHYDRTLEEIADEIESRNGRSIYTMRLRELAGLLEHEGRDTKNYAVHMPMLINRKKMAHVLDKYPRTPMFRALYGNYWGIGGTQRADVKIRTNMTLDGIDAEMISSSDSTWVRPVGEFMRHRFPEPSRFEK